MGEEQNVWYIYLNADDMYQDITVSNLIFVCLEYRTVQTVGYVLFGTANPPKHGTKIYNILQSMFTKHDKTCDTQ